MQQSADGILHEQAGNLGAPGGCMVGSSMLLVLPLVAGVCRVLLLLPLALLLVSACAQVCCKSLRV
jgi:hypothetical protein